MRDMETTPMITTIEHVETEAHQGPAILVHRTEGAFHAQDNPGELVAAFGPKDGVTGEMTTPEVAAITGYDPDTLTIVAEDAGITYWEVGGGWGVSVPASHAGPAGWRLSRLTH